MIFYAGSILNLKKERYMFSGCLIFLILLLPLAANSNDNASADTQPKVAFPESAYIFETVVEGKAVFHDFIIQNKGTKILEVQKVKTDWGCTTVSYSREIPPREEGIISIKVNTNGYGGKELHKNITVLTNDPQIPEYKLKISGMVKKFITIEPRVVRFEGKPGEVLKSIVTITFEKNYPFIIKKSKAQVGEWIQYTIEPWEYESKKGYNLVVVNQKKEAGIYRDAIILETDSLIQPEIRINIIARLMEEQTNTTTNPDKQNLNELIKKLKNKKANTSENIKKSPAQPTDAKKMFEELIKKAQQKKEQDNLSNWKDL